MKQPQSRRRDKGDRVLGLPRRNLSHLRHPPLTYSLERKTEHPGFNGRWLSYCIVSTSPVTNAMAVWPILLTTV
jgi:hypothetical protein